MGHAARELTNRFHLLRLPHGLFGFGKGVCMALCIGIVATDCNNTLPIGNGRPVDVAILAVFCPVAIFKLRNVVTVDHHRGRLRDSPFAIVRMYQVKECGPDDFIDRPAERLRPCGIGSDNGPVELRGEHKQPRMGP